MTQSRKRLAALLLATVLMTGAAACGAPASSAGTGDGKGGASPSSVSAPAPEKETPQADENGFYQAVGAGTPYRCGWDPDGNFVFQHRNTLNVLTPDNELRETVTLPEEQLPQGDYALVWSDSRVLAVAQERGCSGMVYFTDDGGAHLANVVLFDRQGKRVRRYPESRSRDGSAEAADDLPVPEGTQVVGRAGLTEDGNSWVHWLDGETAVIECHSRVVLYDFAADTGRVVDDMSALVDAQGKFGVYYGVETFQCGVVDGSFYYLAHRDAEKSNTAGTIWRADQNGAAELFDGKEFWHLFVGDKALLAAAHTSSEGDAPDIVYSIDPGTLALREVWQGSFVPSAAEGGPFLAFAESGWQGDTFSSVAHVCRRDTGELFSYSLGAGDARGLLPREVDGSLWLCYTLFRDGDYTDWAYDTAAGTAARLPAGSIENILSVSPDGSRIAQTDREKGSGWLRVSPWEF